MQGRRDFGSFHVSNVQEMLQASQEEYQPPVIPVLVPQFEKYKRSGFIFGTHARRKHFFLEEASTFLNHGAFGAVLREALHLTQAWQRYIEQQPVRFLDRELLPLMVYVTRKLAKVVGCDPSDLVLVGNVTTAINSVLKSQKLNKGDVIYHFAFVYGATKKLLQYLRETTGLEVKEVKLNFPVKSKQQVLDLLDSTLEQGTKLAIFDHIPSNTPFVMPIKEMVEICHQKNVAVLVDGAHALGQVTLDLQSLAADYYTTNCHKWFCGPKGTALLYVHKKHQHRTHSAVTSHGYGSGFNSEFVWAGLKDYSCFLGLLAVLNFWETVNYTRIVDHNHQLVVQAASFLMEKWHSGLLAPQDMCGSLMCIGLPETLYSHLEPSQVDYSQAERIQSALFDTYNIEVPIKAVQGHLYVRISAHVYNTIEDYQILAKAVQQLTEKQILSD